MSRRRDLFIGLSLLLAAVIYLTPALVPGWGPVQNWLTEWVRLVIGGPTKLLFLVLGTAAATSVTQRLDNTHPARTAWRLFAVGLALYSAGQLTLVVYQLLLRVPTPFPSAADVFFLLGVAALIPALSLQVTAWRRAGLPLDLRHDVVWPGGFAAFGFAAILLVALRPVAAAPAPWLELALNLAYPLSDALLLIPTVVLLRLAWRLRGGTAAAVWWSVLFGLVALAAADILFAYLTGVGVSRLDSLIDFLFIAAYAGIARGTLCQLDLLS